MIIIARYDLFLRFKGRGFDGVTIGWPAAEAEGVPARRGAVSHGFTDQQIGAILAALAQEAGGESISTATALPADWREPLPDPEIVPSLPAVLVKAILIAGNASPDGRLIIAVAPAWYEILKILQRDPDAAHQIPARKWEEIIAGAYERAGFDEVTLTPHSGDRGRDVIAVKRGLGSIRIIDQVKAYGPRQLVKANDVRALLGVLPGDGASKGFLTTTSDFAPRLRQDPLIAPWIPSRIELINGVRLRERLQAIAGQRELVVR